MQRRTYESDLHGSVIQKPVVKRPLHKVLQSMKDSTDKSIQNDMTPDELQQDLVEKRKQEIKQELADAKGVAVTSEKDAVDLEEKSDELKDKSEDDAEKEIKKTEDKEDDVIEKERNIRLAKEAQKQSEKDELVCKIEKEIETEKEKAKLLYMIENSRKNAIDSARATYGDKADIVGIQRTYDTIANTIDPKLTDVTDMISMSIDNYLHGSQNVKMLMPNGSIRTMDADVAMALSDMPKRSSGITKANDTSEAKEDAAEELSAEVSSKYSSEEIAKLYELIDLMDANSKRQAAFAIKDPQSGRVKEVSEYQRRFKKYGLPAVARDYSYVYYLDETMQHDGRPLPSALSAYSMQEVREKTYDYYK